MGTDKRQRQKEGHRLQREELRRWEKRRAARRRALLLGGAVVAFFAIFFAVSQFTGDDDESDVATEGTTAATTTTIESTTECPPADGSAPVTTTFETPPPMCIDPSKAYTAVFDTSEGEIRVDLDTESTPNTVNNFVVLARYHYYDDNPVFRTDPSIGILQAGGAGPQADPGYTIQDEGAGYTYEPGQIVMARTREPNSASAQFFMVGTDAASNLDADGSYVVFGNTDQAGIDVVNSILALHEDDPDPANQLGGAPSRPVTINSVTIEES
jgi:cyclophilin family peptidyl-prolyl cis-trans isomerase